MDRDDSRRPRVRRTRTALYRMRQERYRLYREIVKLLVAIVAAGAAAARLMGVL